MIPLLTLSGLQSFIRRAYGRWNADGGTVTGDYTGVLREINAITPVRNIDWLYTAQGAKTSVAYALNPADGTGDLAYTGSAGRYFQRADGLFVASGSDLPPFFKDGLASWQSFTNSLVGSEVNLCGLSTLGLSLIAQVQNAGAFGVFSNSCRLDLSVATSTTFRTAFTYNATSGQNTNIVFHIKKNAGYWLKLAADNATASFGNLFINLSNGETSGTATNSFIVEQSQDFIKISLIISSNATTPEGLINLDFFDNSTGASWTSTGTEQFFISGGQYVSNRRVHFPYVKTVGSTVTNVADITTDTDSPQSIKDATELTMFWRGVVPQFVNGASQHFLGLTNNTTATPINRIDIVKSGASNRLRIISKTTADSQINVDFGSINAYAGQMLNIAVRAKNNDYAISFNATATQTDVLGVYTENIDKISLGMGNTNTLQLNGYTELAFIKSGGLTNAELQALSGVGL